MQPHKADLEVFISEKNSRKILQKKTFFSDKIQTRFWKVLRRKKFIFSEQILKLSIFFSTRFPATLDRFLPSDFCVAAVVFIFLLGGPFASPPFLSLLLRSCSTAERWNTPEGRIERQKFAGSSLTRFTTFHRNRRLCTRSAQKRKRPKQLFSLDDWWALRDVNCCHLAAATLSFRRR